MREVGSNTGGVDNIEEGELIDVWRDLAQKREGLAVLAGSLSIK